MRALMGSFSRMAGELASSVKAASSLASLAATAARFASVCVWIMGCASSAVCRACSRPSPKPIAIGAIIGRYILGACPTTFGP